MNNTIHRRSLVIAMLVCGLHFGSAFSDEVFVPLPTEASQSHTPAPWLTLPIDAPLIVTCVDGRRLTGSYDQRSTAEVVWLTLRMGDSASVSTLLPAANIQRIEQAGGSAIEPLSPSTLAAGFAYPSINALPRSTAQSLAIAIRPVNVDPDAAIDGIELFLQPSDRQGQPLVKEGSVVVQLSICSVDVHDRVVLRQSESWTRQLTVSDYSPAGGRLRIPFRQIDLGRYADQYLVAVASVKMRIAGEAALEAKSDYVPIRP